MTNPCIDTILQKMDDLQKEFFKAQGQIMNKDTSGKKDKTLHSTEVQQELVEERSCFTQRGYSC